MEIDLAEPREDHRVLKLACRGMASVEKCHSAGVFERQCASPAFGYDWTHNLTSFTRLKVAFRIPIKWDDDMIGHGQFSGWLQIVR